MLHIAIITGCSVVCYSGGSIFFIYKICIVHAVIAGCPGFESGPHHTQGVNYGSSSSHADARIKGIVREVSIYM